METTIIKCPKCGQETIVQNVDVSYSEAEKILSLPLDENGNPIVSETELDKMLTGSTSAKCYWCEADLDFSTEPQEPEPSAAPSEDDKVHDQEEDGAGTVDIRLLSAGPNKILFTKTIIELTEVSIAEVKELIDSIPCTIVEDVESGPAKQIKNMLEFVGAQVEIVNHKIASDEAEEPVLVKDDRLQCCHCHLLMEPHWGLGNRKPSCPLCNRTIQYPHSSKQDLSNTILTIMMGGGKKFFTLFRRNKNDLSKMLQEYPLPCDQKQLIGISKILAEAAQKYPDCSRDLLAKRRDASDLHFKLYGTELI